MNALTKVRLLLLAGTAHIDRQPPRASSKPKPAVWVHVCLLSSGCVGYLQAAEQLLLASPEAQSPDVFANLAACTPAPQAGPAWALDEDHDHFGEDDARGGMEVSIHGLPPLQQLLHICGQVVRYQHPPAMS